MVNVEFLVVLAICFVSASAKIPIPSSCVLPFQYKDKTFNKCTKLSSDREWCSLDAVYRGRWVYCGAETNEDKFGRIFKTLKDYDDQVKALEEKIKGQKNQCACQKELSLLAQDQLEFDVVIQDQERRLRACDALGPRVTYIDKRITKIEVIMPQITQVINVVLHPKPVRPVRPRPATKAPLRGREKCRAYRGHNYIFVNHNRNWRSAQRYCGSRGGILVAPNSRSENHWVAVTARSIRRTRWWMGANDISHEGRFRYPDGRGTIRAWWRGEPNNQGNEDCVHYGLVGGSNYEKWNDVPCRLAYPFICEVNNRKYC